MIVSCLKVRVSRPFFSLVGPHHIAVKEFTGPKARGWKTGISVAKFVNKRAVKCSNGSHHHVKSAPSSKGAFIYEKVNMWMFVIVSQYLLLLLLRPHHSNDSERIHWPKSPWLGDRDFMRKDSNAKRRVSSCVVEFFSLSHRHRQVVLNLHTPELNEITLAQR